MTAESSREGSRLSRVRLTPILASALAVVLGYAVVRNAVADIPAAASILPPVNRSLEVKYLTAAAQNPKFVVSPPMLALARNVLKARPLSFEPFFLAAKAAEKAGDRNRAILLLEEARRRRPTHVAARLQLMIYYGQARRFDSFLSEMDVVLRRSGEARTYILPELAKLLKDPSARQALSPVLATMPEWRTEFFAAAAKQGVRPEDARDLLSLARRNGQKDVELESRLYLQSLISSGQAAKARSLWITMLPADLRQLAAPVFNGSFTKTADADPFGWVFHDDEVGRSEPSISEGRPYLDVSYFGGKNAILAEQNLALSAGPHRLTFMVRSDEGIKAGDLSWQVICLPKRQLAAKLSFGKLSGNYSQRQTAFVIPPDCTGQILALVGEPGDVAAPVNAQVTRLAISTNQQAQQGSSEAVNPSGPTTGARQ